jgi:predicted house-cleaning NTP pyrophosphatase (Maf/HAM1 superfamily)
VIVAWLKPHHQRQCHPQVLLILASSSPFRKKLLNKLSLDFDIVPPEIDESRKDNETPKQLVFRLAQEKAYKVAKTHSGLIIASDQVATLADGTGVNDAVLTKPQSHNWQSICKIASFYFI